MDRRGGWVHRDEPWEDRYYSKGGKGWGKDRPPRGVGGGGGGSDLVADLERLSRLYQGGQLRADEYQAAKEAILRKPYPERRPDDYDSRPPPRRPRERSYTPPRRRREPPPRDEIIVAEVAVPKEMYGALVGRQASTLAELNERAGCLIKVPREGERGNVVIICHRNSLSDAISRITHVHHNMPSNLRQLGQYRATEDEKEELFYAFETGNFLTGGRKGGFKGDDKGGKGRYVDRRDFDRRDEREGKGYKGKGFKGNRGGSPLSDDRSPDHLYRSRMGVRTPPRSENGEILD